jgi:hypothetical protein
VFRRDRASLGPALTRREPVRRLEQVRPLNDVKPPGHDSPANAAASVDAQPGAAEHGVGLDVPSDSLGVEHVPSPASSSCPRAPTRRTGLMIRPSVGCCTSTTSPARTSPARPFAERAGSACTSPGRPFAGDVAVGLGVGDEPDVMCFGQKGRNIRCFDSHDAADSFRSVGLKVLKNKLAEYVRIAASGETVLVTDRDRVVG